MSDEQPDAGEDYETPEEGAGGVPLDEDGDEEPG